MATVGNLKVDLGLNSAAFDAGLRRAGGSVNSFASTATKALAAFAAAAAAAFSVGAIGRFADEWSDLNSRLTNATGSAEAGAAAMNRLQEVARRSYSSISQTTEAFLSQATTLNALGISTGKQLDLTETLNNALVISATRGDKARSVMDAWAKAMALGELRGDDLNSVITNSDRLAQALADSMGVSVVELRQLGAEGKITRQVMLGITDQLETLRTEAEDMPATLSDGFGILGDSVFQFVGRMDQATGASGNLAGMLIAIGDAITSATGPLVRMAAIVGDALGPAFDVLGPLIGIATAALAGFFAPAVIAGLGMVSVAIGTTMVGAVRALTAAMLANPLGLLIAGIAAAVTAAFMFRDQIKQAIGVDVVEVFNAAVNGIVGGMVGAFNAIIATWGKFPGALGDLAYQAGQFFLDGINQMVQTAVAKINEFIANINGALDGLGVRLSDLGSPAAAVGGRWTIENPYEGAAGSVADAWGQAFTDSMAVDYVGQLTSAVGELWGDAEGAAGAINNLGAALDGNGSGGGAAGSAGSAGAAAQAAAEDFQAMGDIGNQVSGKLADSFTDMFIAVLEGGKNLGDMIVSLLKDLGRMFLHQGFQALLGMGGGGLLGGLFSGIGSILGFARGGTIMPGGAGGIDSQLVAFRKSPNERVDITKPGQTLTDGGGRMGLDVSVSVDEQGNLVPMIRKVSGQGDVQVVKSIERNIGGMMADYQMRNG